MLRDLASVVPHRWRFAILVCVCFFTVSSVIYYKHTSDADIVRGKSAQQQDRYSATSFKPEQQVDGFVSQLPRIQADFVAETPQARERREARREAVKASFLHAWNGYKKYAMGADELRPISNKTNNNFGGLGATMIDSLSTMLIMDLDQEFEEVLPMVEKLNVHVNDSLSVFETTIRYVGGLLSAYELSNHPNKKVLLNKAEDLAIALLPAFDTPYGIPYYHFNPITLQYPSYTTYLADAATVQLEFYTLSHHTGNPIFAEKAQVVTDFLDSYKRKSYKHGNIPRGLFPNEINVRTGKFLYSDVGFGAMGDSAYEYFLKEYIMSNGKVPQFAKMYKESIDSMKKYMLRHLPGTQYLYLPSYDTVRRKTDDTMDHLTCFAPGMLAIGSRIFNRPEDMSVAKGILDTCVYMYRSSSTKLSPDSWIIDEDDSVAYDRRTYARLMGQPGMVEKWWKSIAGSSSSSEEDANQVVDFDNLQLEEVKMLPLGTVVSNDPRYLLRPETLESLFVLYRMTGDPKYQEYGWEIFQGIEEYCKTPSAYASVKNVHASKNPAFNQIDSMETFLLAETFKYLYLLFSPPDVISLDEYVLNTEAHPFHRRSSI